MPSVDEFRGQLINQEIVDIRRKGKWLIFVLTDYYLLSHLRMEGKYFYKEASDPIRKHDHVIFDFSDGTSLRYNDVRKFGKMYLVDDLEKAVPFLEIGLEPWDEKLVPDYLKSKYQKKRLPIKTLLLDQTIITGIGNIYADEILFLSKINPLLKPSDLTTQNLLDIIDNTKRVLEKAISLGGTTIRSYTSSEGVTGKFQNELYVHAREKGECLVCKTEIIKIKVNGRGTYYCPNCQK